MPLDIHLKELEKKKREEAARLKLGHPDHPQDRFQQAEAGLSPEKLSFQKRRRHTVRRDETVHTIADRFGLDEKGLMDANEGVNKLRPGISLNIPSTPLDRRIADKEQARQQAATERADATQIALNREQLGLGPNVPLDQQPGKPDLFESKFQVPTAPDDRNFIDKIFSTSQIPLLQQIGRQFQDKPGLHQPGFAGHEEAGPPVSPYGEAQPAGVFTGTPEQMLADQLGYEPKELTNEQKLDIARLQGFRLTGQWMQWWQAGGGSMDDRPNFLSAEFVATVPGLAARLLDGEFGYILGTDGVWRKKELAPAAGSYSGGGGYGGYGGGGGGGYAEDKNTYAGGRLNIETGATQRRDTRGVKLGGQAAPHWRV